MRTAGETYRLSERPETGNPMFGVSMHTRSLSINVLEKEIAIVISLPRPSRGDC